MPCLFESERVSVNVWDISLLRQNCRAEFCSPHENMPRWFHLISDHRLCSPVIIRKYLFQTFCASNIILWLKETIPAMLKRQQSKNTSRLKNVLNCSVSLAAFRLYELPNYFNQCMSTDKPPNNLHATYLKQHFSKLPQQPTAQAGTQMRPNNDTTPPSNSCWGIMGNESGVTGQWGPMSPHGGPFQHWGGGLVKGPAIGEKGASHGPLCMNAPTSRPVSPSWAVSLASDLLSLPRLPCSHPAGMFVFVCVLLFCVHYFTSVTHLRLDRLF